jgi:acyl-coenzyme A synthetase/AMP-(fatty) acid ligase
LQSRYWVAVAFAAALLRGQVTLLHGDRSERGLTALAARFPGMQLLIDDAAPAGPWPACVVGQRATSVAPPAAMPRLPAGQVAAIVFTSGSSGEPIGTAKSFGELAARSVAAGLRFGFRKAHPVTVLGTVPPHHMYGFETTVLLPFHAPASSWCGPGFYPADVAAALANVPGPCVLVTTPLQLRAMLEMPAPPKHPDLIVSATAPLDTDIAAQAERQWGAPVMEIFGATEVGSIASRRTLSGSAWSVYPGISLTGGQGPEVRAPGAEVRRFNDVVDLAANGKTFRLIGRCGDLVKLAGRRASLAGLTRVLTQMDGVEDGVFVAPDDLETRPTARLLALVVSPKRSSEDLIEALRGQIESVFLPRPLLLVPALPRNALGKLPRDALLSLARRAQLQDRVA